MPSLSLRVSAAGGSGVSSRKSSNCGDLRPPWMHRSHNSKRITRSTAGARAKMVWKSAGKQVCGRAISSTKLLSATGKARREFAKARPYLFDHRRQRHWILGLGCRRDIQEWKREGFNQKGR